MQDRDDIKRFLIALLLLPLNAIFCFTIPNCKIERLRKWYMVTFIMSICWLAVLSYFMVWMVICFTMINFCKLDFLSSHSKITIIGYTIGIPDVIMGVTFLAAGTSIPDAYSSVAVVRQGYVDMGVSNIFGSNVFDLLIGLAVPWFIKSLFNSGVVSFYFSNPSKKFENQISIFLGQRQFKWPSL